ncbi:MAG: hypothetical protein H6Q58_1986 [Firmicutes bacterium]|nr:hypothetical protein [Bacillota bacterium]
MQYIKRIRKVMPAVFIFEEQILKEHAIRFLNELMFAALK